jgi:hypothetical protein
MDMWTPFNEFSGREHNCINDFREQYVNMQRLFT